MTDDATPDHLDAFAAGYAEARAKFMLAAVQAGATLHSYVHPAAFGPDGGSLACDVAVLGGPAASKALVVVSGTHGLEGYTGSAAQILLLRSEIPARLPADTLIVLIHAINPWGFAHSSRTTENNVDLNRNFIDHAQHPRNPLYRELHDMICLEQWTEVAHGAAVQALEDWTRHNGADRRNQAIVAGQYSHPQGRMFGGMHSEWSNLTLQSIARKHLCGVDRIAFIDWHTGLGRFGEEFFLCFNQPGSDPYRRCIDWWGRERIETDQGFEGAARPRYQGLLFDGLSAFVRPAQLAGAVIEFGTRSNAQMDVALMIDYWLKFGDTAAAPDRVAVLRHELLQAFYPCEPQWRQSVAARALAIQRQAFAGLLSW